MFFVMNLFIVTRIRYTKLKKLVFLVELSSFGLKSNDFSIGFCVSKIESV